jgi:hypothetical protein
MYLLRFRQMQAIEKKLYPPAWAQNVLPAIRIVARTRVGFIYRPPRRALNLKMQGENPPLHPNGRYFSPRYCLVLVEIDVATISNHIDRYYFAVCRLPSGEVVVVSILR